MKVKELIEKLRNLNPENEIWILDFENGLGHPIDEVYSTTADKINYEPAHFIHVESGKTYPEGTEFSFIGTNVLGEYAEDYDPIVHTFIDDNENPDEQPEDAPLINLHDVARIDEVIPDKEWLDRFKQDMFNDLFFDEE